ncbi:MAG: DNA-processing protein DprA [Lachnospiraceae bacterium]|nr:DNA-processing protein DprA [Lachnospiraceae bacterium]
MRRYDYWLCSIPGIGNRSIEKLLGRFGSAKDVYTAKDGELAELLKEGQLAEVRNSRRNWIPDKEYGKLKEKGIVFLTREDADYPDRLMMIPDAPYGIFYKGALPSNDILSVAIIGARDCSEYGSYVAGELGRFLGERGVQVISGMARGIDGISQEAALLAGGSTTGVLGCGVDICYPKQNQALYHKILERGCILSSYPPGTLPKAQNFPPRNRIVSGLADAVVVIEARNKSGTLITVDMALEQGKEVYVVPGRITDRLSDGCNGLLKQGAGILLSPEEFLAEIRELWEGNRLPVKIERRNQSVSGMENPKEKSVLLKLPEELQRIYELLDYMPKSVEEIWAKLADGTGISELNIKLMKLCLMDVAVQESNGYFGRKAI